MKIEGHEVVFQCRLTSAKYGLSDEQAMRQDMAYEYAVCTVKGANAGIIVYANHGEGWLPNPWSTRFLILELLEKAGIKIENTQTI